MTRDELTLAEMLSGRVRAAMGTINVMQRRAQLAGDRKGQRVQPLLRAFQRFIGGFKRGALRDTLARFRSRFDYDIYVDTWPA